MFTQIHIYTLNLHIYTRTMEQKNKGGSPRASRVQKKSRAVTVRYSAMQYDIVRQSDSGKIETTADQQHLLLKLYNGERFANASILQNFGKRSETG